MGKTDEAYTAASLARRKRIDDLVTLAAGEKGALQQQLERAEADNVELRQRNSALEAKKNELEQEMQRLIDAHRELEGDLAYTMERLKELTASSGASPGKSNS